MDTIPFSQMGDDFDVSDNGAGAVEVEAEADIYWILKRLPKRQAECFKLFSEGYTETEISNKLCISRGNVSTHLGLARKKIGAK